MKKSNEKKPKKTQRECCWWWSWRVNSIKKKSKKTKKTKITNSDSEDEDENVLADWLDTSKVKFIPHTNFEQNLNLKLSSFSFTTDSC